MNTIDLVAVELPPSGDGAGVFADVDYGTVTNKKGKLEKTMTLVVQLADRKSDGERFIVKKTYVLNRRGINVLKSDLQEWREGKQASGQELRAFNAESEFLGKPCLAAVNHRVENGQSIAVLAGYRPNPESGLKVSSDFVRSKDKVREKQVTAE